MSNERVYGDTQWGPTLLLNLMRSVAASVVWFFFVLIVQGSAAEAANMLLLPVIYFAILLPLGLFAILLSEAGVPFVWFLSLMAAFAIVPGDPVLFLINLIKPGIVPVRDYSPLNFKLIMLVKA